MNYQKTKGSSAVTYAIVIALIVLVAAVGIRTFGSKLNEVFSNLGCYIQVKFMHSSGSCTAEKKCMYSGGNWSSDSSDTCSCNGDVFGPNEEGMCASCPSGQKNCNGTCFTEDNAHCVSADGATCTNCTQNTSTGKTVCSGGQCVCGAEYTDCSDTCVKTADMKTDISHCGGCDACKEPSDQNAHATCGDGECGFACNTEYTKCGDECKNLQEDFNNCGSCGNVCLDGKTCCGGACVDTQTDLNNCGSCTAVCTTGQTCSSGHCCSTPTDQYAHATYADGRCGSACNAGYTNCDGTCTLIDDWHCGDGTNCENCGARFAGTNTCSNGVCVCSENNICGNACCDNGQKCSNGLCCPNNGSVNCNGTCVDVQHDANNCGECGKVCAVCEGCDQAECFWGECVE